MLLLLAAACTGTPEEEGCADAPGIVCRVAGAGVLGFNGDGLPATESWLYFPSAVRRHPDGRLVFVDFNNMRVRALAADGTLVTLAGNGERAWSTPGAIASETALENPVDVVWAPDGSAFLLPLHEQRVLRWRTDDVVEVWAGTGDLGYGGDGGDALAAMFSEASGLALGDDGALYVADTLNNAVRVVKDGRVDTLAGAAPAGFVDGVGGDARFSGPQRLATHDGVLFVADANNHAVRAVDLATRAVTTLVGTGVPGDSGDGGPATDATLAYPYGVAVGAAGDLLYIADSGNNRVRRVRDGLVETVAGTGAEGLEGDGGPALDARFAFPVHALVDGGDLFVADMKNGAIRVVRGVE